MKTIDVRKVYSHTNLFGLLASLLTKYCLHVKSMATWVTTAFEMKIAQLKSALAIWAGL